MKSLQTLSLLLLLMLAGPRALAQEDGMFTTRSLTPETALAAATAALESCREGGYQVAVVISDRMGVPQVLIRDRFAGPHTLEVARRKAWTAVSFRANTSEMIEPTAAGKPLAGVRHMDNVAVVAGGVMIEAAGSLVGAIGVSGAPAGDIDEQCALAGIEAIEEIIGF